MKVNGDYLRLKRCKVQLTAGIDKRGKNYFGWFRLKFDEGS